MSCLPTHPLRVRRDATVWPFVVCTRATSSSRREVRREKGLGTVRDLYRVSIYSIDIDNQSRRWAGRFATAERELRALENAIPSRRSSGNSASVASSSGAASSLFCAASISWGRLECRHTLAAVAMVTNALTETRYDGGGGEGRRRVVRRTGTAANCDMSARGWSSHTHV